MIFIKRRQEKKIEEIIEEIICNGALTIEMTSRISNGLFEKKQEKLNEVIEIIEPKLKDRERVIEGKCIEFLALWHPQGKILRTITMLLMINRELTRIGALCAGAAEMSNFYFKTENPYLDLKGIKLIFSKTVDILLSANESFTFDKKINSKDVFNAYSVLKMDNEINKLRDEIIKKLILETKSYSDSVESIFILVRIVQKFERIGDHCKNIAEEMIYIVTGKLLDRE